MGRPLGSKNKPKISGVTPTLKRGSTSATQVAMPECDKKGIVTLDGAYLGHIDLDDSVFVATNESRMKRASFFDFDDALTWFQV